MSYVDCDSACHDYTFLLFPLSEQSSCWLHVVVGAIVILESDVNDGVIMTFPEAPNNDVTPSILFYPPMTYLFVRYSLALFNKWFFKDAVQ